jgi:6-phospho-3-hexuloisomerase
MLIPRDTIAEITAELSACLDKVSDEQVERALEKLECAPRIFIAAAGRSALGARGFAMRLMHLGKEVHIVGETTTPPIAAGDLLVIASGSGQTKSLVGTTTRARQLEATVLLFTLAEDSPIADLADQIVLISAPSPKAPDANCQMTSIQPMGSLFEQSLFVLLDCLILLLMNRQGTTAEEMFSRHANLE